VREMVIKGLGLLRYEKAAMYARAMLSDENWRVRRACLETMEYLDSPELLDVLNSAASDETDAIRLFVAHLAGMHRDDKSVDVLISLLNDRNIRVTKKAIESLVRLEARKAVPYLMDLAERGEPSLSKYSIWALGELGVPEAESVIMNALRHHDNEIKKAASKAFEKLRNVNNGAV